MDQSVERYNTKDLQHSPSKESIDNYDDTENKEMKKELCDEALSNYMPPTRRKRIARSEKIPSPEELNKTLVPPPIDVRCKNVQQFNLSRHLFETGTVHE